MATKTVVAPSTEILPAEEFRALTIPAQSMGVALRENIGNGGVTPFDLDRVKIPSGGGVQWEVPTLAGIESVREIEGIIIHFKDVRSYWAKSYGGGNQPPDCASTDGLHGVGSPGGVCAHCPMAQFGTASKSDGKAGKGQACKQARMLFILRRGDLLPLLIVLPPSSLKPAKQYFIRLTSKGVPFYGVITKLSLTKVANADGIPYSQVDMKFVDHLSDDRLESVRAMRESMRHVFDHAQIVEADVVGAQ